MVRVRVRSEHQASIERPFQRPLRAPFARRSAQTLCVERGTLVTDPELLASPSVAKEVTSQFCIVTALVPASVKRQSAATGFDEPRAACCEKGWPS